jgi:sugar/nucleoside kinase (ribokinase family)
MTIKKLVKFIAIGEIHNEFIIDVNGKPSSNLVGGPLVYSAAAMKHWGEIVGLVGVVGNNFLPGFLKDLQERGLDTRGIKCSPQDLDLRTFYAYGLKNDCIRENPVAIYSYHGLPFPNELYGYAFDKEECRLEKLHEISRTLLENLPSEYQDALAAYISPLDLTSQIQFSNLLLKGSVRTLTIQPHPIFMNPVFWEDIPVLVKDATAIITSEPELRALFRGRSADLWEMMEAVAHFGCKFVIVSRSAKDFSLFDATNNKKFRIPRYPVRVTDPTGEMDSFAGAFLSGFQNTYDPIEACIKGSVTASIVVQRSGAFAIDDCLPGLDRARMDVIRDMTVQM